MKKTGIFINLILLGLLLPLSLSAADFKTLRFPAGDGLPITADFYGKQDPSKTIILLFHQAGYSRGEYRSIAPFLLNRGFNILAVDLRSGYRVKGVRNETAKQAVARGKKTTYVYALPDMKAALKYVRDKGYTKIILWGSSYSAGLALKLAAEEKQAPLGVIAFSPGEYFGAKNFVGKALPRLKSRVWITSTKSEKKRTVSLYQKIKKGRAVYFLPKKAVGLTAQKPSGKRPGIIKNTEHF